MEFDIYKLLRPNIQNLSPYSSARDEFYGDEGIFLDANENPFPSDFNRYPDPFQRKLKEALAPVKGVRPSEIILGNGSDEILDLIFRSFCIPGKDSVVTIKPSYGMYRVLADLNDLNLIEVALNTEFQIDASSVLKAAEEAKLIILCSPNNPTGNELDRNEIHKILQNFNGIVVIDEAYSDFSDISSAIELLDDYPNLIISQTLSKAYGLAGIRIGIGISSEEIIRVLNTVKPPYNVNAGSQRVALERLKNTETVHKEIIQIKMERSRLFTYLQTNENIIKVYPTEANFILFKVNDANIWYKYLVEKGIVIRNRTNNFGCTNCLRITVGTNEENNRFMEIVDEMKNNPVFQNSIAK
ncbi:MAG: histidinol-phosphate transaminase [Brumimicrobium sp.]|nr:histidinol-phosphate transaminase [Brumimicrobium sp.]